MYNALKTQCEAEKAEALFTLNNYMYNSVGIGEHPQQVAEAMSALEKLASANDKLDNLLTHCGEHVSKNKKKLV